MLSLAAVAPSLLGPLQNLLHVLFALVLIVPLAMLALFVLSKMPGKLGRFASILMEVLSARASGPRARASSRKSLERAYQKRPAISSEGYPFRVNAKAYFFSRSEGAFYPKLVEAAAALDLVVFPKVGLCDVFVDKKDAEKGQSARYSQMHVDYLLARNTDYGPLAGIELNGANHQAEKQQANDRKKKAVFDAAGLPLLIFFNQPSYSAWDIQTRLQDVLGLTPQPSSR